MRVILVLLLGLLIPVSKAADLEVTVEGIDTVEGQLLIGIFNTEENFRIEPLPMSKTVEITEVGTITVTIKDLPPGPYAIAAIWDLNKNGVLDTAGFFKRPTEPVAFSMDPKMTFGPPSFEDCMFVLEEPGAKVHMVLQR